MREPQEDDMNTKDEIGPVDGSDTVKFNSQRLAQLGRAVVGERSVQEFCKETSLSRSLVSRLLNGSLKGPPTIRSIYRFAGSNLQLANEMLKACGYPTGAIEHLTKIPDMLREAEKNFSVPSVPILTQNKASGLSLMLAVLADKQYGDHFNIDYRTDGSFAIQSVSGHTLVGIPAFCTSEIEIDEVWKNAIRSFALSLTRWNSSEICYFLFTNSKQLFAKLTATPNINYKLAVLLTTDGYHFHSQHVIPPYGASKEEQDESVLDFPIRLSSGE